MLQGDVFQDEHGIALGSQVMISAENFGLELTHGELVAATRTYCTLRRTDERVGQVACAFSRASVCLRQPAHAV